MPGSLQLVGNILEGSNSGKSTHKEGVKDHTGALDLALHYLKDSYSNEIKKQVSAIGHRVVHGKFFDTAKLVTPEIEKAIEDAAALAPLHNPPNLQGITAAKSIFPGQPQVCYFLPTNCLSTGIANASVAHISCWSCLNVLL